MEKSQAQTFRRRVTPENLDLPEVEEGDYFEASVFDLISAFSKILKVIPKKEFLEIIQDEFTVSRKVHDLLHLLVQTPVILFSKLFEEAQSKSEIVATFLATLELIRLKEIVIRQNRSFGEIQIMRHPEHMQASEEEDDRTRPD